MGWVWVADGGLYGYCVCGGGFLFLLLPLCCTLVSDGEPFAKENDGDFERDELRKVVVVSCRVKRARARTHDDDDPFETMADFLRARE